MSVVLVQGKDGSEGSELLGSGQGKPKNIYPGSTWWLLNRSGVQVRQLALANLIHNHFFLQERRKKRADEDKDKFCIGTK